MANLCVAWLQGDATVVPERSMIDPEADTAERLKKARTELWRRSCPSGLQETNWSHPDLIAYRKQIDRVRTWEVGQRGLLLAGRTGRGKSRSLWALLKRLMCEEARDVGVWTAADWFAVLQSYVSYGRDDAQGFVRACAVRPILVIDDLGQEAVMTSRQDWARSHFFALLDQRLGAGLPMLVTTNLTANQLAGSGRADEIRGEPLVRRLMELCEVIKFEP